jgi:hypothetical protein
VIIAICHFNHDRLTAFHELQELKVCVPMAGDYAVARLSRERANAQMAWRERQRAARTALEND